jgi:hypothetical protein
MEPAGRPVSVERSPSTQWILRVASGQAWSVFFWFGQQRLGAGQSLVETRSRSRLIRAAVVPQLGHQMLWLADGWRKVWSLRWLPASPELNPLQICCCYSVRCWPKSDFLALVWCRPCRSLLLAASESREFAHPRPRRLVSTGAAQAAPSCKAKQSCALPLAPSRPSAPHQPNPSVLLLSRHGSLPLTSSLHPPPPPFFSSPYPRDLHHLTPREGGPPRQGN